MFGNTPVFRSPEKTTSGSNELSLNPFLEKIVNSLEPHATAPSTTSSNQENDENASLLTKRLQLLSITALQAENGSRPFFLRGTHSPDDVSAGRVPAARPPFKFIPFNAQATQPIPNTTAANVHSKEKADVSKAKTGGPPLSSGRRGSHLNADNRAQQPTHRVLAPEPRAVATGVPIGRQGAFPFKPLDTAPLPNFRDLPKSNDLEGVSFLRRVARMETFSEKLSKGRPSNAGLYPTFRVKKLRRGPSGAHGKTFFGKIASSGTDGRREALVFIKSVPRHRMEGACADVHSYGRLGASESLGIDESVKKFRAFVVDLEGLHEDPQKGHIDFIFGLYQCSLSSMMNTPQVYGTEGRLKLWAAQVTGGLTFLHSIGIIHCDVKPANILVDWRRNLLITDFDLSHVSPTAEKLEYDRVYSSRYCGTEYYMAPEVEACKHNPRDKCYGPKIDFFSFGIVLYELSWTAYNPTLKYKDHQKTCEQNLNTLMDLRCEVSNGEKLVSEFYNLLHLQGIVDACLQELLAQMMDPNPATRPDFAAIVVSPWFEQGLNEHGEMIKTSNPFEHILEYSLKRRKIPIPEKRGEDILGDEEPEYTAKAYLHSREMERRRTWINVNSKAFNFINSAET